jgi:hypothetical protein
MSLSTKDLEDNAVTTLTHASISDNTSGSKECLSGSLTPEDLCIASDVPSDAEFGGHEVAHQPRAHETLLLQCTEHRHKRLHLALQSQLAQRCQSFVDTCS